MLTIKTLTPLQTHTIWRRESAVGTTQPKSTRILATLVHAIPSVPLSHAAVSQDAGYLSAGANG
jgi:hypothetical protein